MSRIVKVGSGKNQSSLGRVLAAATDKAVISDREFQKLSSTVFSSGQLEDLGPGVLLSSAVSLSGVTEVNKSVGSITPGFDGRILATFAVVTTAVTTASKAVTFAPYIDVAVGTSEVQTLTKTNSPTGGTFTLTFDGEETGTIAWNASAGTIQTALGALSNIAAGDVVCAGGAINSAPVTVTFGGAWAGQNAPTLVVDSTSLTNATEPTLTVATTRAGDGTHNEVQTITPANSPTGGTWTITFSGQTTAALAAAATAQEIQDALSALSNLGPDDVVVTGGPITDGVVTLTFSGAGVTNTNVAQVTVSAAGLTTDTEPGITVTTSTAGAEGVDSLAPTKVQGGSIVLTSALATPAAKVVGGAPITPRIGAGGPAFDSTGVITFRADDIDAAFSEGAVMFGVLVAPLYKPGAAVI